MAKAKKVKQVGSTTRGIDKQRKAKKVGWRKSSTTGEMYFENRRNRSDMDRGSKFSKGGLVPFQKKKFKV